MVDDDEDEVARARRILREARETVERTKDLGKRKQRDETVKLPPDELAKTLIGEDRVSRWRREAEERERQREEAKAELAAAKHVQVDWSAIDARVEQHLVAERTFLYSAVGESIGHLLDKERADAKSALDVELRVLRNTVAQLGGAVIELRAQLAEARAQLKVENRSVRDDMTGFITDVTETLTNFANERKKATEQKHDDKVVDLSPLARRVN